MGGGGDQMQKNSTKVDFEFPFASCTYFHIKSRCFVLSALLQI